MVPQRLIQSLIKGGAWSGIFFTQIGNQYAVIGLTEGGHFNQSQSAHVDERAFLMSAHYFGMVLLAAPLTIFIKRRGLKRGFVTCLILTAIANAIYPESVKASLYAGMVIRALSGILFGVFVGINNAFLASWSPVDEIARLAMVRLSIHE